MANEQAAIIAVLVATMAMFLGGRWRHDMVAAGALLACVLAGLGAVLSGFINNVGAMALLCRWPYSLPGASTCRPGGC